MRIEGPPQVPGFGESPEIEKPGPLPPLRPDATKAEVKDWLGKFGSWLSWINANKNNPQARNDIKDFYKTYATGDGPLSDKNIAHTRDIIAQYLPVSKMDALNTLLWKINQSPEQISKGHWSEVWTKLKSAMEAFDKVWPI